MEKRTLLAILLAGVVWIFWFLLFPPETQKTVPQAENKVQQEAARDEASKKPSAQEKTPLPARISISDRDLKEETAVFETETFRASFSSKGAVLSEMTLKKGNIPVTVPAGSFGSQGVIDFALHFSSDEFLNGNDLNAVVWNIVSRDAKSIHFARQISLGGAPLEIHKRYEMNEKGDSFKLEYIFTNRGKAEMKLPEGSVIMSPSDMVGPGLDYENRYNLLKGIYSVNGDYRSLEKGSGFFSKAGIIKKEPGPVEWVGVASRYLLVIMMPEGFTGTEAVMDNRNDTGFRSGITVPVDAIKAGGSVSRSFTVYVGEKDKNRLEAVDQRLKKAADITLIIEPIRYFVLWCLLNLNKLFGNIGWSLVVFSILTKVVFMPLTKKSTDSMKKMQSLTPKINELKARYKDKPDVMQKEMMKLYKENKVNPLSGCLPILVQMPFFFALYSALINSIDLWNAPFILWIKDLSMPDTVATISGFDINILPIFMTVSTYFQQKLSTIDTGQSKQQQIMMTMMPLIFIFIFWTMPSGLVLYWTLQNVFQKIGRAHV
jgi:YidC/Oxa1 family membrane protein insertase